MARPRGRRGSRGARANNSVNWDFLHPWLHALQSNAANRLLHAPSVEVSFQCTSHPVCLEYQIIRPCEIIVPFPADAASRRDRQRLQRLREAIELFNALAPVSSIAFTTLLGSLIEDNDLWVRQYSGHPQARNVKVSPEWTCQLMGQLGHHDYATTHSPISWSALFGCPKDPWEYSAEFRAAVLKIKAMDTRDTTIQNALLTSTEWKTYHGGIPMYGWKEEPNDA